MTFKKVKKYFSELFRERIEEFHCFNGYIYTEL